MRANQATEQKVVDEQGQESLNERRIAEDRLIKWLKVAIVIGLSLLVTGHYLLEYANLPETMGVNGMIISATCIAFGLVFSLPTKMYLTFLLMKREAEKKKAIEANTSNTNANQNADNTGLAKHNKNAD